MAVLIRPNANDKDWGGGVLKEKCKRERKKKKKTLSNLERLCHHETLEHSSARKKDENKTTS